MEPLDLPENTRVTVALLDGDDVPAHALAALAQQDPAFDFLNDAREDIYADADGEAL